MKAWNQRPFEVRNLFNPAFCGLILFKALRGYEELDEAGMPFSLALLVLPLCLHKDSRQTLEKGNRSYLLRVVEKNPKLLIGFATRAAELLPFALEAFGYLMERGVIQVADNGRIYTIPDLVRKSDTGTAESVSCQRVARFVGKEFARIDDRVTVYTTFGVRP
jgi:hypothetical protein